MHSSDPCSGGGARRAGIQRSTWVKLERNEDLGVIQLNTIRKLAEALDCELIYAIRPKNRLCFSEIIWSQLVKGSIDHPWVLSRPQHLKDRALAAVARNKMDDPEFRRNQNWSER